MTFSNEEIRLIWNRAETIPGIAPNIYRRDECGAWMAFNEFGNARSSLGWQIDFSLYDPNNNDEDFGGLKPLHCQNYRSRENGLLVCNLTSNWKKVNPFP